MNVTAVAPASPPPVIDTLEPMMPDAGVKLEMDGRTVNAEGEVAVPPEVATVTLPVVAVDGTVAVIFVEELTLNLALTPLNLTVCTLVKFDPPMATLVPTMPEIGLSVLILGALAQDGAASEATTASARSEVRAARRARRTFMRFLLGGMGKANSLACVRK